jgi:hypothetical protein
VSRARVLLAADGAACVAAGLVGLVAASSIASSLDATTLSVRIVGALLVALGVEGLALAGPLAARRVPVVAWVVACEVALAAVLAVGLGDGWGRADGVVAALLALAALAGTVHLREQGLLRRAPGLVPA